MQSEKVSFASRLRGGVAPQPVRATAYHPSTEVQENESSTRSAAEGTKPSKTAVLFDAIVSVSLVALFFGIPLFFTGLTYQGLAFEKQIYFYFWLLIGLIAWASKGVTTGELRIRRTPLDIPIALFWLFYVISLSVSVDRWHSFWGFFGDPSRGVISVTALVCVYFFLMSHFTVKRFFWMFGSFLVSGFLVVLWSFLVMMKIHFLPASLEQFAPMSLIGSISTLAVFLGVLLPLFLTALFVLWQNENAKRGLRFAVTGFLLLGIVLDLFLLLALYSFVPWIVVLGGLSFFMVYILAQIVRPAEQWTWVPMLVFVVVLAFLMIGQTSLVRANLPVEVTPNTSLSWQIAKQSLKDHFFLGVGPANYGYAFSLFRPQEYNQNSLYTLRFYQGAGLVFETLSALGVIGAILLLVLWFSFLSVGLYLLTHEKQRNKLYSLGLWTVSVMFFIVGFVAAVNGTILILGVLLGTLSLAVLLWESGSEEHYWQLSLKAAPKFALALAFIFMVVSAGVAFLFVFMGKVFIADVNAGKAIRLSVAKPNSDSVNLFARAIANYPEEGRYYTRLGQEYMALANIEAGKGETDRDTNALKLYTQNAVGLALEGKNRMPNDVMAAESLGLVYENAGLYATDALVRAEEAYGHARDLEPLNPLFSVKLGQIKRAEADAKQAGAEQDQLYNDAKSLFGRAVDLKNNLAVAHYNLAVVHSRLKQADEAIDETSKAIAIDKNNLSYIYNLGILYQLRDGDGDRTQAETIFKAILEKNEKLVDVRLSLGLLYEKENKNEAAITEYQKIIDVLPADSNEQNVKQTRDQVKKLIDNVRSGVGNLTKKTPPVIPDAPNPAPQTPAPVAPVVPAEPNQSPLTGTGQ